MTQREKGMRFQGSNSRRTTLVCREGENNIFSKFGIKLLLELTAVCSVLESFISIRKKVRIKGVS